MFRGTTPTLHLNISGIPIDTLEDIYVTLHQNSRIKDYTIINDRLILDTENNRITVKLTEKETLALKAEPLYLQMRATTTDDNVIATNKYKITIEDIFYDKVIGDE